MKTDGFHWSIVVLVSTTSDFALMAEVKAATSC